jgi:predicted CopG family antitoxin
MEQTTLSLILAVLAFLISIASYIVASKQKGGKNSGKQTTALQLQAYERLVMLSERISLPNLINRLNEPQRSAKEMQMILVENLRQEFEYNASQQIYVSATAWNAVQNLRDQNLMIVNQIANVLPPYAKANDLNKQVLEVIMSQKEKALHTIVLESLNAEAKKLMN